MTKYTAAVALENRKAFQRWLAVKDDGIVGPATLAAFDTRMVNLCAVAVTGRHPSPQSHADEAPAILKALLA